MSDDKALARFLANNWYYHDRKEYGKIAANSRKLLVTLGYGRSQATRASKLISKIFYRADLAEQFQKSGNEKMEKKAYVIAKGIADDVDNILGRKVNSRCEIRWWITIRHKRIYLSIAFLFIDQLSKLGLRKLYSAMKSTKYLSKAGFAHDKKRWDEVRMHLIDYWKCIRKAKVRNYVEF